MLQFKTDLVPFCSPSILIFNISVCFWRLFFDKVGHLSEAHLAFFARWDRTIDLEAKIGEQVSNKPSYQCR